VKNSVTKGVGEITIRKGNIRRGAGSTTHRVSSNCHFVNVYWDHGVDSLVSPQEIVVNDSALVWH